jgi:hypothetical protein
MYQPQGWHDSCRFVVMRIPQKEVLDASKTDNHQLALFEDHQYKYRIFATNLKKQAHKVIAEYDGRADAENLVGEVKREGLSAIPSAKFKNNYAYFYIFMLAYNIWRWIKLMAGIAATEQNSTDSTKRFKDMAQSTVRIARLVLLLIAAKIVSSSNQLKVRFSIHDARVSNLFEFMNQLDSQRKDNPTWPSWKPNCQPPNLLVQEFSCTPKAAPITLTGKDDTS